MKKSKIIVPAMAMIAFTSLASIAGSVAWFTASRQVTVNAGSYAVVKTTTNLECTLANGVGTTASANTVQFDQKLTDGSFNHSSKKVFIPNEAGTGLLGEVDAVDYSQGVELNDANLATKMVRATTDDSKTVYTAVTFKINFTISFGATAGDYGLYLKCDGESSKYTVTGEAKTAKGFRMGIVPDYGDTPTDSIRNAVVFADLQTSANCHYISSKANADTVEKFKAGTAYGVDDRLVDSAYNDALPTESTDRDDALAMPNCLGVFGYAASTRVTLSYIVVAWFEGTDPEIVNRATSEEYQTVTSTLQFEAVKLAAA